MRPVTERVQDRLADILFRHDAIDEPTEDRIRRTSRKTAEFAILAWSLVNQGRLTFEEFADFLTAGPHTEDDFKDFFRDRIERSD